MRKRYGKWMQGMLGALAIMAAVVMAGNAQGQAEADERLQQRAENFFAIAESMLQGKIEYAFAYETIVPLQKGQQAGKLEEDLRTLAGKEVASDIIITENPQGVHVFIRLHGAEGEQLLAHAEEMKHAFGSFGWPDKEWQIRADGSMSSRAGDIGHVRQAAASLDKSRIIDQYQDGQSIIIRYFADGMGQGVSSGDAAANLQIAYHRHSETGRWSAALASPMLTGEF